MNGWVKKHTSKHMENIWDEELNKINNFLSIDLNINNILDIGCGLAYRSCKISEKFNSKLFLLDGDCNNNNTLQKRQNEYGDSSNFKFYFSLKDIHNSVSRFINNYELLDINNIDIKNDIKFDIICSFKSCGFHYPFDTYLDIYKNHSHKDTIFIFDFRDNVSINHNVQILHRIKYKKLTRVFFKIVTI